MNRIFIFLLLAWMAACSPPEQGLEPMVAPPDPPGEAIQPEATPNGSSAENCQVTFTNHSRNTRINLFLNGKKANDLLGCPLEIGQSITICLPVGTHTLYVHSNMYQFSDGIVLEVTPDQVIDQSLQSGP